MMWSDPIVDQIRQESDKTASKFNYDIHQYYEYMKNKERESKETYLSFPPKQYSPVRRKAS